MNPILGQPESNHKMFLPHDVICTLHYFEEKNTIMLKMWGTATANFKDTPIFIFYDLTLERQ